MPREKSVGAIVFFVEGKRRLFLLLRYGAGHWDFPKGHVEGNETPRQAMLRELFEEAGIKASEARVVPRFKERISYFYKSHGRTVFKEVEFFLVEALSKGVRLSFEHEAFKWLSFEEAVERATFGTAKKLLRKAEDFLKQRTLGEFQQQPNHV